MKLCFEIQGCVFGYTQSDEITLVLTDYETIKTDAWFGYNVQKMASISASIATSAFNLSLLQEGIEILPFFDQQQITVVFRGKIVVVSQVSLLAAAGGHDPLRLELRDAGEVKRRQERLWIGRIAQEARHVRHHGELAHLERLRGRDVRHGVPHGPGHVRRGNRQRTIP